MIRLSYSGASLWLDCPRKYYFRYDCNLQKKHTSNALMIGGIVHELLHKFYMKEDIPMDMESYIKAKYGSNEDKSAIVAYEAMHLVSGYLQEHADDPLEVISSEMQIELERTEPITGEKYSIYMIVDAVARDQQKRLWRLEHKTSTRTDTFYLNGLRGGLQGGIYHWGLNTVMPEPVVGTIYNMLVKTKIPTYPRMPVLMQNSLAERSLLTFDGVVRQILKNDIFPCANSCFMYNNECEFLPLCNLYKGEWTPRLEEVKNAFYMEYRQNDKPKQDEESEQD